MNWSWLLQSVKTCQNVTQLCISLFNHFVTDVHFFSLRERLTVAANAAAWVVVLAAIVAAWSWLKGFRSFAGHWLRHSHQPCTQQEMLGSPENYPSMLSWCIHSLYFSMGVEAHRCRVPGESVLELTQSSRWSRGGGCSCVIVGTILQNKFSLIWLPRIYLPHCSVLMRGATGQTRGLDDYLKEWILRWLRSLAITYEWRQKLSELP